MKNCAPSSLGILAIAAIFGFVALIIAYALLNFAGMVSFVIGLIVAIITAIVLWMGWGDADAGTTDQDNTSSSSSATASTTATDTAPAKPTSSTITATPPAAASAAPTAAVSTPATEAKVEPASKVEEPAAKATEATTEKVSEPVKSASVEVETPAKAAVEPVAKDEPIAEKPSSDKADEKPKAVATPAKAAAKPKAAKSATKTAAKSAPKRAPVAADGKPEMLSEPRGGQGDDLKQIKGVGPKMETMLNTMGVWHFEQVAGWRKKEVEWVDNNLEGFKGRVSRDEWVKQAKVLAKGGTTEFSKKVKKGGIY